MSTLSERAPVKAVRVRVASNDLEGPADVFLLELHFDAPAEPLDDTVYLRALADVVSASADDCVIRIGREYRFGAHAGSTSDVVMTVWPQPTVDHVDFASSVTAAFRELIARAGLEAPVPLEHDAALRAAQSRVVDLLPELSHAELSISTEEHVDNEWVIRLVGPDLARFEVRIGFVDGHPGSTHIRRVPAEEVADSIGTE